jgi:hypothetical protein
MKCEEYMFRKMSLVLVIGLIAGPIAQAGGPEFDELMRAIETSNVAQVQHQLGDPQSPKPLPFNINEKQKNGWNPLCLAAAQGNPEIVRTLLSYGARLDEHVTYHDKNATPLILAIQNSHPEVIEAIVNSPQFSIEQLRLEVRTAGQFSQPALAKQLLGLGVLLGKRPQALSASMECAKEASQTSLMDTTAQAYQMMEVTCPICGETPGTTGKKPGLHTGDSVVQKCCGESFCLACLDTWSKVKPTCPNCRADFSRESVQAVQNGIPKFQWFEAEAGGSNKVPLPNQEPQHLNRFLNELVVVPAVTEAEVATLRQELGARGVGEETKIVASQPFLASGAKTWIGLYREVMGYYPDLQQVQGLSGQQRADILHRWEANPDLPLTYTTLAEDNAFAAELNRRSGRNFRVMRNLEVELVIRGKKPNGVGITSTHHYFGNNRNEVQNHAFISSNSGDQAHGVHEHPPGAVANSLGIYPLGNVWIRDSRGAIRGGGFNSDARCAESGFLDFGDVGYAGYRDARIGSLLAEDIP